MTVAQPTNWMKLIHMNINLEAEHFRTPGESSGIPPFRRMGKSCLQELSDISMPYNQ